MPSTPWAAMRSSAAARIRSRWPEDVAVTTGVPYQSSA
jgi:hypothetical protein